MNEISVGDYVKVDGKFYAKVARVHDYPDENPRYYYDLMYRVEECSENGKYRSNGSYIWMDVSINRLEPINAEEKYKVLVALGNISEEEESSNIDYLVGDILL